MFEANLETKEVYLYDEIGPGWLGMIDAASVVDALGQFEGQRVTVRLNTPGGSVDEGIAIYNALRRHPGGVDTVVDSLAASMGSYLLQAGETRTVASNAMLMIHDPWTIALGNADSLRKEADILEKYRDRMVPEYALRSDRTAGEIEQIMADETWYAGHEIVDAGFADIVEGVGDVDPVMSGLHKIAAKIPQALKDRAVKTARKHAGDLNPYPVKRERARMYAKRYQTPPSNI